MKQTIRLNEADLHRIIKESVKRVLKEEYKEQDEMTSFEELIGLDISDAIHKLGYWWRLSNQAINRNIGFYVFVREPGGWIELRTKDNIVTHEHHSPMSERYLVGDNWKRFL